MNGIYIISSRKNSIIASRYSQLRRSISSEVVKKNDGGELILGADGSFTNNKNGSKVEDYAMKVEFSDKSYIRDTLKADKQQIINTITTHLRGI